MNIALRQKRMTREQFFAWAEAQDKRYEFDGFQPVAMVGSTINHNHIVRNIHRSLYARLIGSGCLPMGPDDGVATIGDTVRYPDAVITCTRTPGTSRLVENPVVVFEIISSGNSANDRIIKVREYRAVPTIHTYVIVEQNSIGLTLLRRHESNAWITTTLTGDDPLRLHDPDIEIPITEFYENVDLPAAPDTPPA
ncbi:MAG TPA: Uma2 family endonuclease [Acetobacteraceae bacterium]|nr:Uma2 family endonuclease [Acetobacteraceae bacterium]